MQFGSIGTNNIHACALKFSFTPLLFIDDYSLQDRQLLCCISSKYLESRTKKEKKKAECEKKCSAQSLQKISARFTNQKTYAPASASHRCTYPNIKLGGKR